MKHGPLQIKTLLAKLEAGEITEAQFMFQVSQNAAKYHAKSISQTAIRGLASRMGHAKKVTRKMAAA